MKSSLSNDGSFDKIDYKSNRCVNGRKLRQAFKQIDKILQEEKDIEEISKLVDKTILVEELGVVSQMCVMARGI